jgi:hypothetical protein
MVRWMGIGLLGLISVTHAALAHADNTALPAHHRKRRPGHRRRLERRVLTTRRGRPKLRRKEL